MHRGRAFAPLAPPIQSGSPALVKPSAGGNQRHSRGRAPCHPTRVSVGTTAPLVGVVTFDFPTKRSANRDNKARRHNRTTGQRPFKKVRNATRPAVTRRGG